MLVLHETLLLPVLMTILWKEKERSKIKVVQMDNLRGLLGMRRMYRVPNVHMEFCNVKKLFSKIQ